MSTDGLLAYCRPGFEPELAAELSERAAIAGFPGYARTERNSGYVQFLGVEEVMRAEARETAERLIDQRVARIAEIGGVRTETVIREGDAIPAIERLIAEDPAIGSDTCFLLLSEVDFSKNSCLN